MPTCDDCRLESSRIYEALWRVSILVYHKPSWSLSPLSLLDLIEVAFFNETNHILMSHELQCTIYFFSWLRSFISNSWINNILAPLEFNSFRRYLVSGRGTWARASLALILVESILHKDFSGAFRWTFFTVDSKWGKENSSSQPS